MHACSSILLLEQALTRRASGANVIGEAAGTNPAKGGGGHIPPLGDGGEGHGGARPFLWRAMGVSAGHDGAWRAPRGRGRGPACACDAVRSPGIAPGGAARRLGSIEQDPAHSASPKERSQKERRALDESTGH
jgi:hypothetical protein